MARLLFFGRMRDSAGASEIEVDLPPHVATLADVCGWLAEQNASLGAALKMPGNRFAVDRKFTDLSAPLTDASEIAFMSQLSGG